MSPARPSSTSDDVITALTVDVEGLDISDVELEEPKVLALEQHTLTIGRNAEFRRPPHPRH